VNPSSDASTLDVPQAAVISADCNRTVPNDHPTIQEAVNAASAGETVCVQSGTYAEQVRIHSSNATDRSGLTLKGIDGRPTIDASGVSTKIDFNTPAVSIQADEVTLRGFTITTTDGDVGVSVGNSGSSGASGAAVDGVSVVDNRFVRIGTDRGGGSRQTIGLKVRARAPDGSRSFTIRDNVFQNLTGRGGVAAVVLSSFATDPPITGASVANNTIQNLSSPGRVKGISLDGDVDSVAITDNVVAGLTTTFALVKALTLTEDARAVPDRGPQNFTIKTNRLHNLHAPSEERRAALFIGGYPVLGDRHSVTRNNIGGPVDRCCDREEVEGEQLEVLNAVNNWWGHASGPGGGNGRTNPAGKVIGKGQPIFKGGDRRVADIVDFDPWLPQPINRTPTGDVPPGLAKKKTWSPPPLGLRP
jgi:hypothetical protein